MHLWFALARVPPPRLQPDETSRVATLPESMRVLDGQHVGRGDQVSYTLHLFKQLRFQRLCEVQLEENRPLARVGTAQRRLLCVAQQCTGLERGRTVACLHAADRSRGCLSHPEDGPATSSD